MTVFRAATLRTFFFAFHAGAKELIQRSISVRQADVEIFVLALLGYKFELAVLAHILHVLDVLALLGGRIELIVLAHILHVFDIAAFRVRECQLATSTLIG